MAFRVGSKVLMFLMRFRRGFSGIKDIDANGGFTIRNLILNSSVVKHNFEGRQSNIHNSKELGGPKWFLVCIGITSQHVFKYMFRFARLKE